MISAWASALLVLLRWAMSEPRMAERAAVQIPALSSFNNATAGDPMAHIPTNFSVKNFYKLKITFSLLAMMTTAMMSSCSKEDGPSDPIYEYPDTGGDIPSSQNWAPSSMVGKIISWSEHNSDGTSGNYNVRVQFVNKTDLKTNFSDWTTYTYKQTSSKSAHLNFMAPQNIAGTVRTFQYDFDMSFTSSKEFTVSGKLTVNYLSGPNVGRTVFQKFTGKGKFVTDLTGNDNSDAGPQSPGNTSDVAKFVGTWREETTNSLQQTSYTFKKNGEFSFNHLWLLSGSGDFTCTSSSITLHFTSTITDSSLKGKYRTLTLSNGKLYDKANNKSYKKE